MDTVFKVVIASSRGLPESAFISTPPFRVIYPIGGWAEVSPQVAQLGYHLTAFANEWLAKEFAAASGRFFFEVYEARAEGRILPLPVRGWPKTVGTKPYISYSGPTPLAWPDGTVMYKRIMLLERIIGCAEFNTSLYDWSKHRREVQYALRHPYDRSTLSGQGGF